MKGETTMKLGRNAIITIVVAIIAGVIPYIFKNSLVVSIIGIVLGIAAFVYGLAAFRGEKKNVWNIIALILGICGIVAAVIKLITIL